MDEEDRMRTVYPVEVTWRQAPPLVGKEDSMVLEKLLCERKFVTNQLLFYHGEYQRRWWDGRTWWQNSTPWPLDAWARGAGYQWVGGKRMAEKDWECDGRTAPHDHLMGQPNQKVNSTSAQTSPWWAQHQGEGEDNRYHSKICPVLDSHLKLLTTVWTVGQILWLWMRRTGHHSEGSKSRGSKHRLWCLRSGCKSRVITRELAKQEDRARPVDPSFPHSLPPSLMYIWSWCLVHE